MIDIISLESRLNGRIQEGRPRPTSGGPVRHVHTPARRNLRIGAMLAGLLLVGTTLSPNANAAQANAPQEKSLYDRLGGYNAISAVVEVFADSLFADSRINQFFVGMSEDTRKSFKQKNKNLLCNATGGPCQVISRTADQAHHGLGITAGDFEVVAGHLTETLNSFKVPAREQAEVFAIILSLRPKIVDRPDEKRLSKNVPALR